MTATSNPQAAADQARKNYRDVTTPDTSVPEAVRAMAKKTVGQSREAYDRSKDAFEASLVFFERSFDAAGQRAAAFNRKIIDIAQQKLVDPKTLAAIDHAFEGAWSVLATRKLLARFANECELQKELSQRLVVLASDGVTDPEELRRQALGSFPLD